MCDDNADQNDEQHDGLGDESRKEWSENSSSDLESHEDEADRDQPESDETGFWDALYSYESDCNEEESEASRCEASNCDPLNQAVPDSDEVDSHTRKVSMIGDGLDNHDTETDATDAGASVDDAADADDTPPEIARAIKRSVEIIVAQIEASLALAIIMGDDRPAMFYYTSPEEEAESNAYWMKHDPCYRPGWFD